MVNKVKLGVTSVTNTLPVCLHSQMTGFLIFDGTPLSDPAIGLSAHKEEVNFSVKYLISDVPRERFTAVGNTLSLVTLGKGQPCPLR